MKFMYAICPHKGNKVDAWQFHKAIFETEEDARLYAKLHKIGGRKLRVYRVDFYAKEDLWKIESWRKEDLRREKEIEREKRINEAYSHYGE